MLIGSSCCSNSINGSVHYLFSCDDYAGLILINEDVGLVSIDEHVRLISIDEYTG